jgi:hypothetical protein
MYQTAIIAEPGTAADRKGRDRFLQRFSLLNSLRQPHRFPGGG